MATPATSAEQAQLTQETLASLMLPLLHALWGLFDPNQIDRSVPQFRTAFSAVVNKYARASAAQSLQHYRAVRLDAGVAGRPQIPVLDVVPEGFLDEAMVEALAEAEADIAKATAFLDSQAQHLVLEQGRRQMLTAVALDREAKGWARIPNADACSFCLMLALRAGSGFLYKSQKSASFKAHTKQPNGSGGDCRCTAEPVFGRYEPPARVREAQKVWDEATKGRTGHDARTAFRQAIEGRDVKGAKGSKRHKVIAKGEGRTPENQRAQLRILQAMPPAKTPEAAQWRVDRIKEIRAYLAAQ